MSCVRRPRGVESPVRSAVDPLTPRSPVRSHPSWPVGLIRTVVRMLTAVCLVATSAVSLTITGTITDAGNREPLPWANVVLTGTGLGASSNDDGVFTIRDVPPGEYVLRVSYMGYATHTRAVVVSIDSEPLAVTLIPTVITLPPVDVHDTRELRNEATPESKFQVTSEEIDRSLADDVEQVIELKPGLIGKGDKLYVRGGREDELDLKVNDVSVVDPLTGARPKLSILSVARTELVTGGQNARDGQTIGGSLNVRTREGSDRIQGRIQYETDDFGAPDKTYDNLDRVLVGIGGPTWIPEMTYYASLQGTWQDSYPATRERRSHRRVLDFISIGDRMVNDVRLQGKLAWRPSAPVKLSMESMISRTRSDEYHHNWTWEGYVQTIVDTLDDGSTVTRRGARSPFPVDDTYEYYNAAEHTPDRDERFQLHQLGLRHVLSADTFYTLRLSHVRRRAESTVAGKSPWEYDGSSRQDYYYDYAADEISPFYATYGDLPRWSRNVSRVTTISADLTKRAGNHTLEVGAEGRYNDLEVHDIGSMFRGANDAGGIGIEDRYHFYQPEGGVYAADTWEYEGMVLNLGMRLDAFSAGEQLDEAEIDRRVRLQWSPRVGIAYPVTERDVFSFHYGHLYQSPSRHTLYTNRNTFNGGVVGNPNLRSKHTVAYQATLQHLFNETVRLQFAVYYKDIFGLLTIREETVQTSAAPVARFVNRDYASARGIEFTLTRSFVAGVTGEVSYAYGHATGVASDVTTSRAFRYNAISEQPLDWDVRHSVSARMSLADPRGSWFLNAVYQISSGSPYTPRTRADRDVEPEIVNSRRLPATSTLTVQAERRIQLWGRALKLFVRATNLLDSRNLIALESALPTPSPAFDPTSYVIYYTETGNTGGAYLTTDTDGDGEDDWVALHDPSVFEEGRSVRVGVTIDF